MILAGAGGGFAAAARIGTQQRQCHTFARLLAYLAELLEAQALAGPELLARAARCPAFSACCPAGTAALSALRPPDCLPDALCREIAETLAVPRCADWLRCVKPRPTSLPPAPTMPAGCGPAWAAVWAYWPPFCCGKEWPEMDIDLVFKIAATGIIVAVLNQLLIRSGREDQAMMTTLAGLIVVLTMLVRQISDLFVLIKALFEL